MASRRGRLLSTQIYQNIYPWKNSHEFATVIINAIAYKSKDNSLIAINKPYGVGTYLREDAAHKRNQDKLLSKVPGQPKYCLTDALQPITDLLNSKEPYQILKSQDRYVSGLVLLSNDLDRHKKLLIRSLAASRVANKPPYGYRAITCGYPKFTNDSLFERVGIKLLEVDELGDHKEPIIVDLTNSIRNKKIQDTKAVQFNLQVEKINKDLAVSLLNIDTTSNMWDSVRCYLSSKTAFVLGDVRFSRRIRELMGKKIQVSAIRTSHNYDASDPLNEKVKEALGVRYNSQLPLMLDLNRIRLQAFEGGRGKRRELLIESPVMPAHFAYAARCLNLMDHDQANKRQLDEL